MFVEERQNSDMGHPAPDPLAWLQPLVHRAQWRALASWDLASCRSNAILYSVSDLPLYNLRWRVRSAKAAVQGAAVSLPCLSVATGQGPEQAPALPCRRQCQARPAIGYSTERQQRSGSSVASTSSPRGRVRAQTHFVATSEGASILLCSEDVQNFDTTRSQSIL
eukprot:6214406-Pleurochrysis_carterae.AAC.5